MKFWTFAIYDADMVRDDHSPEEIFGMMPVMLWKTSGQAVKFLEAERKQLAEQDEYDYEPLKNWHGDEASLEAEEGNNLVYRVYQVRLAEPGEQP